MTSRMLERGWLQMLLAVATLWVITAAQDEDSQDMVRQPPSIIEGPGTKYEAFKEGQSFTFQCQTSGEPKPDVKWFKDGKEVNNEFLVVNKDDGSITMKQLTSREEGFYQCRASNSYGTTVSDTVFLQYARTEIQSDTSTNILYTVDAGDPLEVKCKGAVVIPKNRASFSWVHTPSPEVKGLAIHTGKRIAIDEEGNLHFAFVEKDDMKVQEDDEKNIYKCNVRNGVRDTIQGGSYSQITVNDRPLQKSLPKIAYPKGNKVIVALKGDKEAQIMCLFSGYPVPNIKWERVGQNLDATRHIIKDITTRQVLLIQNVELKDEGKYKCTGFNSEGTGESQIIDLKVEQVPTFPEGKGPKDQNVTQGENAVFTCVTDAIPQASVQWLKNGEPVAENNIKINNEEATLTVLNVQKPKDLMVIQCNASNKNGYTFSSGYLNVLLPTVFVVEPEGQVVEANVTEVMFHADATSDISTPVTYHWTFNNQPIAEKPGIIEVLPNHTLWINFTGMNYVDKGRYVGTYEVTATNGYDPQTSEAQLYIKDVPTQAPVIITTGSGFDLWWVIVVVALLLLLLLLLLCCCLWCQRNRGDAYPVDEKERANGNDPEKELADDGYKDYVRPEGEPVKGSRASLNSSIKLESDDEGSLNEYGDIDTGRFNEDGSFIGQYGDDRRKKEAPPPYRQNDTTV